MRAGFALLILLGVQCLGSALALTGPPPVGARSEVAIREVILSDGERRYVVPIKIGNTPVEAGLDTGSTGLRVLPNVLAASDATHDGDSDRYGYGAGTEFVGKTGTATVAVGDISGTSSLQLIETTDCLPDKPHCPASRIPMEKFGIEGSGLPGEGFRAILGINMAGADVASPLSSIGVKSWIVELPRPGDNGPGKLILNPGSDDVKNFVLLPIVSAFSMQRGGLHDSVAGCLINVPSKAKACGVALLDTGAPGIRLVNGPLGRTPWPNGTAATLAFYDGSGSARAVEYFTVGSRAHASRLMFEDGPERATVIFAGLSPYFAFDILYDPGKREIGFRPRPAGPNAPVGQLVATK
jgi:hypothetical protein